MYLDTDLGPRMYRPLNPKAAIYRCRVSTSFLPVHRVLSTLRVFWKAQMLEHGQTMLYAYQRKKDKGLGPYAETRDWRGLYYRA